MPSAHHSSSSSSTNAPSEPTIDLSSWSPRSHQSSFPQTYEWRKKTDLAVDVRKKGDQALLLGFAPLSNRAPTLLPRSDFSPPSADQTSLLGFVPLLPHILPTRNHTVATENQQTTFQIEQSRSLWHASPWSVTRASLWSVKHASLLPTSGLFAINPLSLLSTTKLSIHIIRKIRGNPHLNSAFYADLEKEKEKGVNEEVHLFTALITGGQGSNMSFDCLRPTESPFKPKRNASFLPTLATGPLHLSAQDSHKILTAQGSSEMLQLQLPTAAFRSREGVTDSDQDPTQQNLQSINAPTDPHYSDTLFSPNTTKLLGSKSFVSTSTMQHTKKLGKNKMLPTRRSPRLQTKQRTNCNQKEASSKPKSRTGKLHFDLHSRDSPLDVGTVLSILQSTGLQINDEIKQMIQDSLTENPTEGTPEVSRPSTPLHDATLPLVIPGEDMVL